MSIPIMAVIGAVEMAAKAVSMARYMRSELGGLSDASLDAAEAHLKEEIERYRERAFDKIEAERERRRQAAMGSDGS